MEGNISANWIQWTHPKRIKERGTIPATEIGRGEREVLSCSNILCDFKDKILNLVSVPRNQFGVVWLQCKTIPPRQQCIFATLQTFSNFLPIAFVFLNPTDSSQKSVH